MPEVTYLDHLERWYERNRPTLSAEGINSEFGRGGADYPKSVAWVNVESSGWLGELLVWTSGEVELGATKRDAREAEINEHHEIQTDEALDDLLARLIAIVRGGTE